MICYYYDAPQYLFFAADLPALLYYSHIPVAIMALIVGFFVFFNNPRALLNRLLLLISLSFALLTLSNLITWTNINSGVILFAWSLFGALQALISVLAIYFVYVFVKQKDVTRLVKSVFLLLVTPVLFLGATNLNLSGFDLAWCDAFAYEGGLYNLYYTLLGLVAMVWGGIILTQGYLQAIDKNRKQQILLMGIGIESFLFIFFSIFYLADYLTTIQFVEDSRLELYGFFGMGIFVTMLGFLIVRFKTFNIAAHASQALVIALLILVASQYTYAESIPSKILTSITLVLTAVASLIIVRSVKKEIQQRQEIENLAERLKKANKRLRQLDQMKSEFVSIASHQLRSPLTSIRGYASMLLEGTYGKLSSKASDAVTRISESSQSMASSVEDYLNVSRIEAGNMKYEMIDFNLAEEASHVVDDKRQEAVKGGLVLSYKSDMDMHGIVNADIGKTRQVLHNLINNSLKYTPRGTVTVFVHDEKKAKQLHIDIIDSGIGMKPDELEDIFGKFERAHNANQTNVTGTGLGLFVARKMARAMGGEVAAFSDGVGHGATFRLTLPLQM